VTINLKEVDETTVPSSTTLPTTTVPPPTNGSPPPISPPTNPNPPPPSAIQRFWNIFIPLSISIAVLAFFVIIFLFMRSRRSVEVPPQNQEEQKVYAAARKLHFLKYALMAQEDMGITPEQRKKTIGKMKPLQAFLNKNNTPRDNDLKKVAERSVSDIVRVWEMGAWKKGEYRVNNPGIIGSENPENQPFKHSETVVSPKLSWFLFLISFGVSFALVYFLADIESQGAKIAAALTIGLAVAATILVIGNFFVKEGSKWSISLGLEPRGFAGITEKTAKLIPRIEDAAGEVTHIILTNQNRAHAIETPTELVERD